LIIVLALTGACGGAETVAPVPTTLPVLTTLPLNLTTTTTEPAVQRQIYTVQPGNTLGLIASRFNTSVEAIREANGLQNDMLSIGQTLIIPPPTTAAPTTTSSG